MPKRIPPWLDWELHFIEHVKRRMIDRGFNEVDLRVVVEPNWDKMRLDVITAWAVEGK